MKKKELSNIILKEVKNYEDANIKVLFLCMHYKLDNCHRLTKSLEKEILGKIELLNILKESEYIK